MIKYDVRHQRSFYTRAAAELMKKADKVLFDVWLSFIYFPWNLAFLACCCTCPQLPFLSEAKHADVGQRSAVIPDTGETHLYANWKQTDANRCAAFTVSQSEMFIYASCMHAV